MMAPLISVSQDVRALDVLPGTGGPETLPTDDFAAVIGRASERYSGDESDSSGVLQVYPAKSLSVAQSQPIGIQTHPQIDFLPTDSPDSMLVKKFLLNVDATNQTPNGHTASFFSDGRSLESVANVAIAQVSAEALSSKPTAQSSVILFNSDRPVSESNATNEANNDALALVNPLAEELPMAGVSGHRTLHMESSTAASTLQTAVIHLPVTTTVPKKQHVAMVGAKDEMQKAAKADAFSVDSGTAMTIGSLLPVIQATVVTVQESALSSKTKMSILPNAVIKSPADAIAKSRVVGVQAPGSSGLVAQNIVSPDTTAAEETSTPPTTVGHELVATTSALVGLGAPMSESNATGHAVHTPGLLPLLPVIQAPLELAGNIHGASLVKSDQASPIETADIGLSPAIVRATPTSLEVGVATGAHGWLKIRAELTSEGKVSASLSGGSDSVASGLRSELPALTSYLAGEKVAINSLVVAVTPAATLNGPTHALPDTNTGLDSTQTGGAATDRRGDEAQQRTPTQVSVEGNTRVGDGVAATTTRYGIGTVLGDEISGSPVGYGSGGWLNVRV